jgi:hypothetical protein
MLERLLFIALQDGIAETLAKPALMERFFRETRELSLEEIAGIRTFFEAQPPNIIHAYPRTDSKFPLFAIVLANETESQQFLGDQGGMVGFGVDLLGEATLDGDDPDLGANEIASIEDQTYMVLVATRNPDTTIYYYQLAKFWLKRARAFLKQQGVSNLTFSGGDLAPDERYMPANLFVRQLTIQCKVPEILVGQKEPSAFKLDGIYVDATGSPPADLGGVKTLITATVETE